MYIYFPVWADVYGSKIQSSKWLGYLLIASPCGVVIGYGMCAIMLDNLGWRYAFYVQSLVMIPCLIGIFMIPSRYFDIDDVSQKIKMHEMDEFKKQNPVIEDKSSDAQS